MRDIGYPAWKISLDVNFPIENSRPAQNTVKHHQLPSLKLTFSPLKSEGDEILSQHVSLVGGPPTTPGLKCNGWKNLKISQLEKEMNPTCKGIMVSGSRLNFRGVCLPRKRINIMNVPLVGRLPPFLLKWPLFRWQVSFPGRPSDPMQAQRSNAALVAAMAAALKDVELSPICRSSEWPSCS